MPIFRRYRNGQAGPYMLRGVITLVQEDRFTLQSDDGSYRLFLLAHDCPTDAGELEQAMRRRTRIAVACDEAGEVIAAQARRIYQADDQPGAPR